MFQLMGMEINAVLGAQIILIWTYEFQRKNLIEELCKLF